MTVTKRHGAEIVFVESPKGGSWSGRLVNPDAQDRTNDKRARYVAVIRETEQGRFETTTQGWHTSSRRYASWDSLNQAQENLSKWARRRFYVEAP